VFVWALAAAPAAAGTGSEALVGSTCALSNLVYGPVKMTFSLIGGLVGGLAYVFSFGDAEASTPIIRCALRGDYVITPAHLRRERELELCGRSDEQRAARDHAAPARNDGNVPETQAEDW
jgi:hypothetical protein